MKKTVSKKYKIHTPTKVFEVDFYDQHNKVGIVYDKEDGQTPVLVFSFNPGMIVAVEEINENVAEEVEYGEKPAITEREFFDLERLLFPETPATYITDRKIFPPTTPAKKKRVNKKSD